MAGEPGAGPALSGSSAGLNCPTGQLRHTPPQSPSLVEPAEMCFLLALDPKATVQAKHQDWTRPCSTGVFMATEVLNNTQSCPSGALIQEGRATSRPNSRLLGELPRVGSTQSHLPEAKDGHGRGPPPQHGPCKSQQ